MTADRPTSALWFEPRSDTWSGEFLGRLASLASAAPFGTGWLVARRTGFPGVAVVGGDRVAREVAVAAAGPWPGRIATVGSAVFGVPDPADRFAALARPGWGWRSPDPAEPAPGPRPVEPVRPRLEVAVPSARPSGGRQCHWFSTGTGRLAVRVRVWARDDRCSPSGSLARLAGDALETLRTAGVPAELRELPNTARRRDAWGGGRVGSFAAGPLERLTPGVAAAVALGPRPPVVLDDVAVGRHIVVVGASGAGKTSLLAEVAANRVERGAPVVAFDLHGDLAPAIAARLTPPALARLVAIDAGGPLDRIPGVRLLGEVGPADAGPAAAHVVAALKRLTSDSGDVYWGFRLERTLDAFVRLAQEEGGGLVDVYALLTDPRRRDAARLTTRQPALAAFLDELPALLRRNAEYLAPATARVAKVALAPRIARLLDPDGPGLPVVPLLGAGRSIVWRIPFADLGPEGAGFAATLLATHVYLALASLGATADGAVRAAFVVDEASSISPRLLAEILADGRKFGVGAVVATQYPGRLAPEARAAAEGAAGTHVVFRVPAPVAAATAEWAGLDRSAEPLLSALPDGTAVAVRSGDGGSRGAVDVRAGSADGGVAWESARAASAEAWGAPGDDRGDAARTLTDAVAFALAPGPCEFPTLVERTGAALGAPVDPAAVAATVERLHQRGWVAGDSRHVDLTDAGARYLGVGAPTGATSEGAEHRALLYATFAILARRGARLDLVRQGGFDRRLPDGVVRLLPAGAGDRSPGELDLAIRAARTTWAWRSFGGRDADVEAEVSGAVRPDRIRRNLEKARSRGHFALFVVADPAKARKVRSVLAAEGVGVRDAQVWTVSRARIAGGSSTAASRGERGAGP
ncbi:MAG: DUF853 family protein [Thermoplasmata archaeon]|nr:DUF853 family protein [Thermoplasmata archaeon]